jgi:hypothetical protein
LCTKKNAQKAKTGSERIATGNVVPGTLAKVEQNALGDRLRKIQFEQVKRK